MKCARNPSPHMQMNMCICFSMRRHVTASKMGVHKSIKFYKKAFTKKIRIATVANTCYAEKQPVLCQYLANKRKKEATAAKKEAHSF